MEPEPHTRASLINQNPAKHVAFAPEKGLLVRGNGTFASKTGSSITQMELNLRCNLGTVPPRPGSSIRSVSTGHRVARA
eukprot:2371016-Rhodomonas_salina.1